jgi:hypothetical protein
MSAASATQMGNDNRANVLPVREASGPGFLGPNYSPADEMLPPASIGVRRGGNLSDVVGAVKGVIYYGDMIGFGKNSSAFTERMPGLKPLGVNYFINSGITCSNGAVMWEYVKTIPDGSALGQKVKNALSAVGLPPLRGMAPGMIEDVQYALDPAPVINAVVGSGYPRCRLEKRQVGDFDGQIQNVDGVLLVDPSGLMLGRDGKYYQERWIQDRNEPTKARPGEDAESKFQRGDPIQLSYEDWVAEPKIYREDGCRVDPKGTEGQPKFCSMKGGQRIKLEDGTFITAFKDGFQDYSDSNYISKRQRIKNPKALVTLSVAIISIMCLISFWGFQKRRS